MTSEHPDDLREPVWFAARMRRKADRRWLLVCAVVPVVLSPFVVRWTEPWLGDGDVGSPSVGPARFGDWKPMEPNKAHKAETDGFVLVYTHDGESKEALDQVQVLVGKEKSDVLSRSQDWYNFRRCRTNKYDGTVCPVPRDKWWIVRATKQLEGNAEFLREVDGRMTVYWMAVK